MHDRVKHDHEGMRKQVKTHDDINKLFRPIVETQELRQIEEKN
jgi:hypothetical protein